MMTQEESNKYELNDEYSQDEETIRITVVKSGQEVSRNFAADKEDFDGVIEDMLNTIYQRNDNQF